MQRKLDKNIVFYTLVILISLCTLFYIYCAYNSFTHWNILFVYSLGIIAGAGLTVFILAIINNHIYKKTKGFDEVAHSEYKQLFDDPKRMQDADKKLNDLTKQNEKDIKKFEDATDEHKKLSDDIING